VSVDAHGRRKPPSASSYGRGETWRAIGQRRPTSHLSYEQAVSVMPVGRPRPFFPPRWRSMTTVCSNIRHTLPLSVKNGGSEPDHQPRCPPRALRGARCHGSDLAQSMLPRNSAAVVDPPTAPIPRSSVAIPVMVRDPPMRSPAPTRSRRLRVAPRRDPAPAGGRTGRFDCPHNFFSPRAPGAPREDVRRELGLTQEALVLTSRISRPLQTHRPSAGDRRPGAAARGVQAGHPRRRGLCAHEEQVHRLHPGRSGDRAREGSRRGGLFAGGRPRTLHLG